jgi:hypothetical protein
MADEEHYDVVEPQRFSFDDTETIILNTASQRDGGIVLPVLESIKAKPEQVQRKLKRLLKAGLIEEVLAKLEDGLWRKDAEDRHLTLKLTAEGRRTFDTIHFGEDSESAQNEPEPGSPATKDVGKKATKESGSELAQQVRRQRPKKALAARDASGAEKSIKTKPQRSVVAAAGKKAASASKSKKVVSDTAKAHSKKRQPTTDSKGSQLLAALGQVKGATLGELMKISGWQAHSVRGFLSGTVKKKLRLKLKTEIDSKGTRRYLVAAKRAAS